MQDEKLEMIAKQLVRMRRQAGGLLSTLNHLLPVINIALDQFRPKCRVCFANQGLLNECQCDTRKTYNAVDNASKKP